jgi:hypothetical protein
MIASIENPQVIGEILSHLGIDRPQAEQHRLPAARGCWTPPTGGAGLVRRLRKP